MSLCWSHIPHCWKSHVAAPFWMLNRPARRSMHDAIRMEGPIQHTGLVTYRVCTKALPYLNAHTDISCEARGLNIGLIHPYFVSKCMRASSFLYPYLAANSECSCTDSPGPSLLDNVILTQAHIRIKRIMIW